MNLKISKISIAFTIFLLNALVTYVYAYFFIGSFNANDLWEAGSRDGFNSDYFLIDVLQYQLSAKFNNINDTLELLSNGSTNIHASLFKMIFGDGEHLEPSILINSALVALIFSQIRQNFSKTIFLYLLLSPYFIFYTFGWTKEIPLTLSLVIIIFNISYENKLKNFIAYILMMISRPQFFPILLISIFSSKLKVKYINIFLLLLLCLSPFWLAFTPEAYYNAASSFYQSNGGQGYSIYSDYLKYNIPILSIIGYIVQLIKIYFEPLFSVINSISYYAIIELYLEILFFLFLIGSKNNIFNIKLIKYLFIFVNIFIGSLPFTHFRYLMPMLVPLILLSATFKPNLKS